jgi:hypothetical protein
MEEGIAGGTPAGRGAGEAEVFMEDMVAPGEWGNGRGNGRKRIVTFFRERGEQGRP